MTPERWRQITDIFHAALQHEPVERAAFVAEACGDDDTLCAQVNSLVIAHHQASGVGDPPRVMATARFEPGKSFGPYWIEGLLGVGGVGEVYRARDSRLARDVAIKVLPQDVTSTPDRLARFAREARLLASLNHPHIAAIYGVEDAGEVRGLVLELVEGHTLADRLAAGPLPIDEAITYARQIAEALEAGHEHGIVHRDLRPANIKITPAGDVKILAFGLARVEMGGAGASYAAPFEIVATGGTSMGLILGTPSYLSPEQARGQVVDHRTDIWAFGCVLYEMLTERAAFPGETWPEAIAAILEREPAWALLPPATPQSLRRVLQQCLQKDPGKRLLDIGDARLLLEEPLDVVAALAPGRVWTRAAARAGALVAATRDIILARSTPTQPPRTRRRF